MACVFWGKGLGELRPAAVRRVRGEKAEFFRVLEWESGPVLAAFSTRRGGVSRGPYAELNLGLTTDDRPEAVWENRRRLSRDLGVGPENWTWVRQVHGAEVVMVDGWEIGEGSERGAELGAADALITSAAGPVLTAYFADCVPLLFYCPRPAAVGVAHAGWRGTAAGVAVATVERLKAALGVRISALRVVVGPHIRPCCYQVGEEVVAALRQRLGPDTRTWAVRDDDRWRVDLGAANVQLLLQAGLRREQISRFAPCTSCHRYWFYSFRRDRGVTGRFAAVISLTEGRYGRGKGGEAIGLAFGSGRATAGHSGIVGGPAGRAGPGGLSQPPAGGPLRLVSASLSVGGGEGDGPLASPDRRGI
ncbi:MAG: peptidoglycan editing factor PgeF [Clostridia bacterium]|nr:peptidoglycan editing factor PgeF [Clostridia bacterium]MDH7572440.1 peptidoglycan editing factor PgeF [Clostridia bacterium]